MRDQLAEAIFHEDPLSPTVPIPNRIFWAGVDANCTCRATEEQLHAEWCGSYGIYAQLCDELVMYPRAHLNRRSDEPRILDWRWVCGDFDGYHTGGEINGPEHWCVREGRWITRAEWPNDIG